MFNNDDRVIAGIQALVAGNFLNLALFLIALSVGEYAAMICLLVSWSGAWVSGTMVFSPNYHGYRRYLIARVGSWLCLSGSIAAMIQLVWSI